jgi:protein TonB
MALRCLLFSSDEAAVEPISQVLAGLDVEGESCAEGPAAVERVTSQSFQIVIIDWDQQPEAGFLLKTARERKASERPLTLAIVSDDASVPKALQAGANSILRKPIMVNQVNDTLTTACDLLRAKQESATHLAQAAAAGAGTATVTSAPALSTSIEPAWGEPESDKTLRAGEFLNSSGTVPGAQFHTESDTQRSLDESAVEAVDPLEELEPMAASVTEQKPAPAPSSNEPRGLQWYLNARAATAPVPPPVEAPPVATPAKPELLAFDQTPSPGDSGMDEPEDANETAWAPPPKRRLPSHQVSAPELPAHHREHEQKAEAKLFAYISGESEPEEAPRPRRKLGKLIVGATLLAACGVAAAPQAPWHPQITALWGHGQQAVHAWLNPQLVTTRPAPAAHESLSRAGDEYKLPVAENIPDATTDPSQIQVVPVIDPTAKKPTGTGTGDQTIGSPDGTGTAPADTVQPSGAQENKAPDSQTAPDTAPPAGGPATTGSAPATTTAPASSAPVEPPHSDPPAVVAPSSLSTPMSSAPAQSVQPKNLPPSTGSTPADVPSSLKSQIASMTPDASGNKPVEAALPSIEPIVLPEATERALLADQPAIDYPASARGQHGTVILQVLIGRDGTVQDAKFLQGSLAFARNAIDGVRQWKFRPYLMNGRPASVQTTLTLSLKPTS